MARAPAQHYLVGINAAVDSPRSLEVLQHALLEWTGQAVHSDEVFEVLHAAMVERASGVHALDDGGDIPKHYCVHQRCRGGNPQCIRGDHPSLGSLCSLDHPAFGWVSGSGEAQES